MASMKNCNICGSEVKWIEMEGDLCKVCHKREEHYKDAVSISLRRTGSLAAPEHVKWGLICFMSLCMGSMTAGAFLCFHDKTYWPFVSYGPLIAPLLLVFAHVLLTDPNKTDDKDSK